MEDYKEISTLVEEVYKNILGKFNPCARQLVSAGKEYLKALHGGIAASKTYYDALTRIARHAHQATWGSCTDIGSALLNSIEIMKDLENQQTKVLRSLYGEILVPLETNIEIDEKTIVNEQKQFLRKQKTLQECLTKAHAAVQKQQKKKKKGSRPSDIEKDILTHKAYEEQKMKLDCFYQHNLKLAVIHERKRFGFILEKQCVFTKQSLAYHTQGQDLIQRHLKDWEQIAKSRSVLPKLTNSFPFIFNFEGQGYSKSPDKLHLPPSDYGSFYGGGGSIRKAQSMDINYLTIKSMPNALSSHRTLTKAFSEFNIASPGSSLASEDYGTLMRKPTLKYSRSVEEKSPAARQKVRAIYDYVSSGEDQLSFREGDMISLIGKKSKGWQYGENYSTHRSGWFPIAYTERADTENDLSDSFTDLSFEDSPSALHYNSTTSCLDSASVDIAYSCNFDFNSESDSIDSSNCSDSHLVASFKRKVTPPKRPLSLAVDTNMIQNSKVFQQLRHNEDIHFLHSTPGELHDEDSAPSGGETTPTTAAASTTTPVNKLFIKTIKPYQLPLSSQPNSSDGGFGASNIL